VFWPPKRRIRRSVAPPTAAAQTENGALTEHVAPIINAAGAMEQILRLNVLPNGGVKNNQWLTGICRGGVWKTQLNGAGCSSFMCDAGTCLNNVCTSSILGCTRKTCANIISSRAYVCGVYGDGCGGTLNCGTCASGQQCIGGACFASLLPNASECKSNLECASQNCSYGNCCDNGQCGWGDSGLGGPRMCIASGGGNSNQWLTGVCRNGIWKAVINGFGCDSFICDSGTCVNNVCVQP